MYRLLGTVLVATVLGFGLPNSVHSTQDKKEAKPNPAAEKLDRNIARHKLFLTRIEKTKGEGDVIFLGDSITQGWEGQGKIWEQYFGSFKPVNLGISGDQTGHVLWRITTGKELDFLNPRVAVIMIGTNNTGKYTAEQIAGGITTIVEELKTQKPRLKILLLGVFPRGSAKDADKATKIIPASMLNPKIAEINAIISKLHDGKVVFYKDIGKDFLSAEGGLRGDLMPDYLHLSGMGYHVWGKAIKDDIEKLLK